jgi:hypothetical protein
MIIGIHQPNFCPWSRFFNKIRSCDVFVILRHCQYEKGGFQNRFQSSGWHTMSVNKGLEPIFNKRYLNPREDWAKIISRFPGLHVFSDCINESLWETNLRIISRACELLKIDTRIELDWDTGLTSTDRLVSICQRYQFGDTVYLSGNGALDYLEIDKFTNAKINVQFQNDDSTSALWELLK